MDILLSVEQARILGALMEKEVTTPDYYPMTMNALVNACNQKSCREPVMNMDEATVSFHLDILRDDKRLVALVSAAVSRVPKFKQRLTEQFFFSPPERAMLCELLLRGPQTAGELRNRADRMHAFANLDEVAAALKELETRGDGPWVKLLPRLPGHKEARFTHLLCGIPQTEEMPAYAEGNAPLPVLSPTERIARLEDDVMKLRQETSRLQEEFVKFRSQFES